MDKMNLGDFSPKVMAAILYAVVTLLAFSVYPMLVGAGNTIHLNTENACVLKGARFDRVLLLPTGNSNVTADNGNWEHSFPVAKDGDSDDCVVSVYAASAALKLSDAARTTITKDDTGYKIILPTGEDGTAGNPSLTSNALAAGSQTTIADSAKWEAPVDMFTENSTLVNVVIGALALLIGVSPMSVLGMIGYYILNKFDMEQGSISTIIMVVLGSIIAVSLLSTFISFISTAYDAIDASRFTVFEGGLANLAVVIKQGLSPRVQGNTLPF